MSKIRKLNFFDKPKLKELRPFLNTEDDNLFIDILTHGLPGHLQYYLPLKYKLFSESYLLTEGKRTLGLITVNTFSGNPYKINISQLFFLENHYEVAQQLIEFVVSQYGAMGAHTFFILVDDKYYELSQKLINSCGFRQCANEQIWEAKKQSFKKKRNMKYRRFKNSDVKEVADIYNDSVIQYYKPTLLREEKEFYESNLSGLRYATEYRYVVEDSDISRIIAYFKIATADNKNYIVDFNYSIGYDVDFETILSFATREILRRTRHFKMYVKLKNYVNTNEAQKVYFEENGFTCVNTKNLYIKDFFRLIEDFAEEDRFATIGGLHNSPSFKVIKEDD